MIKCLIEHLMVQGSGIDKSKQKAKISHYHLHFNVQLKMGINVALEKTHIDSIKEAT